MSDVKLHEFVRKSIYGFECCNSEGRPQAFLEQLSSLQALIIAEIRRDAD